LSYDPKTQYETVLLEAARGQVEMRLIGGDPTS